MRVLALGPPLLLCVEHQGTHVSQSDSYLQKIAGNAGARSASMATVLCHPFPHMHESTVRGPLVALPEHLRRTVSLASATTRSPRQRIALGGSS